MRLIYLDEPQPKDPDPTFLGHFRSAIGTAIFTLVVDTTGFNDKTQVDEEGITHSDRLHVVERFKKIDGGTRLEDQITIEDLGHLRAALDHAAGLRVAAGYPADGVRLRGEQPQLG